MAQGFDKAVVAHRLRVLRCDRRMGQAELAEAAGLDVSSIAKYETGEVAPTLSSAYRIATALRCSIDEIAGLAELHALPADQITR